jgi:hypothetical protein
MNRNEISGAVVDAAMKVHLALGPGLLASAYAVCLKHELIKRGLKVACFPWCMTASNYQLDIDWIL